MGIRFNLAAALEGGLKTAQGQLAGQIAGQTEQRARDMQFVQQQLQMAEIAARQNQQTIGNFSGLLPSLDLPSRGPVVQRIGEMTTFDPYSGVGETPEARRLGWSGIPRPPAVTPPAGGGLPPGTGAEVADGLSLRLPGIGQPLRTIGVEPKEATAVNAGLDKELGELDKITVQDPNLRLRLDAYVTRRTSLGRIDTPDKLTEARGLLAEMQRAVQGLGTAPQAQQETQTQAAEKRFKETREWLDQQNDDVWWENAPGMVELEKSIGERRKGQGNTSVYLGPDAKDIEAIQAIPDGTEKAAAIQALRARKRGNLSPREEAAAVARIRKDLDSRSPLDVTPAAVREAYQNGRVGYLVENLPDDAIRYGDARLYTRRAQLMGQISQFVNKDEKAQGLFLGELADLHKRLRMPIEVPSTIPMSEEMRLKISRLNQQIEVAKSAEVRAKEKHGWERRAADAKAQQKGEGDLSKIDKEELTELRRKETAARETMEKQAGPKALAIYMDQFDYAKPKNDREKAFKGYVDEHRKAVKKLEVFWSKRGRSVTGGSATGTFTPTPKATPPVKPKEKTPFQKAGEAIVGAYNAATGQTTKPGQPSNALEGTRRRAEASGPPLSPQDKQYFQSVIRAGKFETLMAHPSMRDPANRVKAKKAFVIETGRDWTPRR